MANVDERSAPERPTTANDGQVIRLLPGTRLAAPRPPKALHVPGTANGIISRKRLLAELHGQGGGPPSLLLIAPIGCGKTHLLIELAERCRREAKAVSWLTLSSCHNEPQALLEALAQAMDCQHALPELDTGDSAAWAHAAARHLLAAVSHGPPSTVCLDNIEALSHPACQALIELLIKGWPQGHHLYCAGRSLRAIRVGQALLDGRVVELGAAELAFDPFELAELARMLNCSEDGSARGIESATFLAHGWVAGARALLTARTRSERAAHTVPAVLERYFEERICGTLQSEQSRELMELATIGTFNAALLAELPQKPISWSQFDSLCEAGAYFERLDADWHDDSQPWYRLQPLLAEFLVTRYKRSEPLRVATLHRFAAEWFEKRGLPDEAVRHALQCSDHEFSVALLERAGALGLGLRQGVALFRSTGGLMGVADSEHPLLGLGQVYVDVQEGRVVEARAKFESLRSSTNSFQNWGASVPGPEAPRLADLLESILEKYEDRPRSPEALRRLQQHVDAHDGDPIVRATHASLLGLGYLGNGMFQEAQTVCEIGLSAVCNLRARHTHFCLRVQQAHAAIALGRLQEAALQVERARELAVSAPGGWTQGIAIADVLRGVLYYESNEIDEAEKLLWRALPREPVFTGWFEIYALGYCAKVSIACMKHGESGAVDALKDLESLSWRCRLPRLLDLAAILRLRSAVRSGNFRLAMEMLKQERLVTLTAQTSEPIDCWGLRLRTPALLECARVLIGLERSQEAAQLLDRVDKRYVYEGDARVRFEYLALSASVAFRSDCLEEAYDCFASAVELALQARLTRKLLDHRSDLLCVFDSAVSTGQPLAARSVRYCESVLRDAQDSESSVALDRKLLADRPQLDLKQYHLTARETEIMAFIAEGLSSKEISHRLSVSESTVKTHRKKVYLKLGVSRRSQAIARARAKRSQ